MQDKLELEITIPSMKLPPGMAVGILAEFENHPSNPKELWNSIVRFYRKNSSRVHPPSEKNIVRAVTLTSLRHLGLVQGIWPHVRLTANGRQVLDNLNHGPSEASRVLGRIVLDVDEARAHVVSTLQDAQGGLDEAELLKELARRFRSESEESKRVLEDRLAKWLLWLDYFELVSTRQDNRYELNKPLIEAYRSNKHFELTKEEFLQKLFAKYQELRVGRPDLVYMPIPDLRDAVCQEVPGMLHNDFYKLLVSIKRNTEKYSILLSEPMTRQEGGLRLDNKYFYYVAIFKKGS
jgi:hypothetical protein